MPKERQIRENDSSKKGQGYFRHLQKYCNEWLWSLKFRNSCDNDFPRVCIWQHPNSENSCINSPIEEVSNLIFTSACASENSHVCVSFKNDTSHDIY